MDELLKNTIIQLLGVVISGGIAVISAYMGVLVAKATQKANLEIAKIKDEQQKKLLSDALAKVDSLLRTNIIAVENTIKKDMLEAIEDGKIDKSELKKLALNVKENVLKQMGDDSLAILNDSLGDVNGYIEAKLEEVLVEIKMK